MPPRLQLPFSLWAHNGSSASIRGGWAPALIAPRSFTSSPSSKASTAAEKRRRKDPYALAQARARKAANASRQEVLKKERAAALGDPVRGITTPFVESFDTAIPQPSQSQGTQESSKAARKAKLNFFLTPSELDTSLSHSELLSAPIPTSTQDVWSDGQASQKHRDGHNNAAAALARITSLSLGSSKDRTRVNIQRCMSTFGRHNTDKYLKPRPAPALTPSQEAKQLEKTPRVGPDTGSSEVQIAILTAKIRTLANFLESRGKSDKVNKRNLRLLVHRRAKLLQYLRKKERGGERWQNLISTLGLTEGTWKGEITL